MGLPFLGPDEAERSERAGGGAERFQGFAAVDGSRHGLISSALFTEGRTNTSACFITPESAFDQAGLHFSGVLIYIQTLYMMSSSKENDDMATSTVNISFPKEFLEEIDRMAEIEARSRSELIREATRMYLTQRKRWDAIFAFGAKQGAKLGLTEKDIAAEIGKYRARKKK